MRSDRRGGLSDIARVAAASVLVFVVGGLVLVAVSVYEVVERETGGGARYLPLAYVVAWAGIVFSAVVAVERVVARIRARRPIGWAPIVAVPLLVESWLAGLLVAMVAVSI
ncbi:MULTISPECIES: hypothetical protein [Nocardia]|uniref:Uncharacterized protein n=1 Tax=Nocardia aurea TaxID=2144174 RepID=A0ABV3G0K3_9NOCA|nr:MULTISPECIES: hypothetical protein [Nocardia]